MAQHTENATGDASATHEGLRILLVKTRGRSTSTLQERLDSEAQGLGPRGTLFERTLGAEVLDEVALADIPGLWGAVCSRLPAFVAQALVATRRAHEFDVVITWSERHSVAVAGLFALFRVRTPHLAMMFWMSKPRVRIPLRIFRSGVDKVVTWSSVQKRVAHIQIGFRSEQVLLVKHPVDQDFFAPIPCERAKIFSAGSTQRDFPTLLKAAEGIPAEMLIGASLVVKLQGGKILTTDVRESLKVPENVEIRQLSSVELRQAYAGAFAVVVPLLESDIDAGINVILEAMAMECPVIVSRTEGQVDALIDGVTGIFVPVGDYAALRKEILWLRDDRTRAEALGQAARRYVVANHRLEDFVENVHAAAAECAALGSQRGHFGAWRRLRRLRSDQWRRLPAPSAATSETVLPS